MLAATGTVAVGGLGNTPVTKLHIFLFAVRGKAVIFEPRYLGCYK